MQKELIRTLPAAPKKIVNDEIIFVRGKGAKAQHTFLYVSILLSAGMCKKSSSERYPQHQKIVMGEEILC
ncbi:MAG: hypothetical protein J6C94_06810 [Alistipes sp.]|nr:hypothetical protein [Alistipes sp.]